MAIFNCYVSSPEGIPFFQGHGERIGARQHRQLFRLGVEAWCEASWTSRRRLDDDLMGGFHWAMNGSNQHRYGKPMVSQGKWSTNGGFSMVFCIFLHNIHVTMVLWILWRVLSIGFSGCFPWFSSRPWDGMVFCHGFFVTTMLGQNQTLRRLSNLRIFKMTLKRRNRNSRSAGHWNSFASSCSPAIERRGMKLLELAVVKPLKCRVLVENMFCSTVVGFVCLFGGSINIIGILFLMM